MSTIDRYCSKEFFKYFAVALASFTSLYLIIDFFEKIRMFLSNRATLSQMSSFFIFSIPMVMEQMIPACVLIASLATFGALSRNNELTALKACGVSLYRTALPIIAFAVLISITAFFISDIVSPYTNQRAEQIRLGEILKQEMPGSFKQNQLWYRGRKGIYNFKLFDLRTNVLQGITLYYLDNSLNLVKRIDAEKGEWKNNRWVFYDLITTSFAPGEFPRLEAHAQLVADLPEEPENFKMLQKNAEIMGYRELRRYVREIQADGYNATSYLVDMHAKLAFPLASVILAIIGIASAVQWERGGSIAQGVAAGIVVGFSYWLAFAFMVSLGHAAVLPPLLAAWTADILFALAAGYLFFRIRT